MHFLLVLFQIITNQSAKSLYMQTTIQNEYLKITAKTAGAELTSVFSKTQNKELLWNANTDFWPRHAPVLFPIVGKLKNNTFAHQGKHYQLPQHGFARDNNFELEHQTENSLTFLLKSHAETLLKYPFDFELRLVYTLQNNQLHTQYVVKNTGTETQYFSIGAHPAFMCPLFENEKLEDYYLVFEKPETLDRHLLADGLFDYSTESVLSHQRELPLNESLFEKDAVVFKNMASEKVVLKSNKSNYTLEFTYSGFPHFGIWSKKDSGFLCLEPWCGYSDYVDASGEISEKIAIQSLVPQAIFERTFSAKFSF